MAKTKKLDKFDFCDENGHYDYGPVFSRLDDVDIVEIWGPRSIGKTYGLRMSCVDDFLKRGERFVEVVRFASELDDFATGYFNKFEQKNQFPGYMFKVESEKAFIAAVPIDEDEPPEWELFGYFVALTNYQAVKKITFANVRKIIFDEAAIEKDDNYHNYLPNEFAKLHSIFMTVSREEPNVKTRTKIFLLGNSCDLLNPYIRMLNLSRPPKYGLTTYNDGSVLVHYVDPWDAEERRKNTAAGRLANLIKDITSFENKFEYNEDFIEKKPHTAKYMFAIRYLGADFAFWLDFTTGYFYINRKVPKNQGKVYAFTTADHKVDSRMIERNGKLIKNLKATFYEELFRYEDLTVKEDFLQILGYFGIK